MYTGKILQMINRNRQKGFHFFDDDVMDSTFTVLHQLEDDILYYSVVLEENAPRIYKTAHFNLATGRVFPFGNHYNSLEAARQGVKGTEKIMLPNTHNLLYLPEKPTVEDVNFEGIHGLFHLPNL